MSQCHHCRRIVIEGENHCLWCRVRMSCELSHTIEVMNHPVDVVLDKDRCSVCGVLYSMTLLFWESREGLMYGVCGACAPKKRRRWYQVRARIFGLVRFPPAGARQHEVPETSI